MVETRTRVLRDSEQICDEPRLLPAPSCWLNGSGSYRIVLDTDQHTLPTSTRTTTEWTLQHDAEAPAVPLVLAEYEPPVDLYNANGRATTGCRCGSVTSRAGTEN